MRTLSDSLSLSDLSIYLTFLLFIPFSFPHFFLPSSSLMSWTKTTRIAAEKPGSQDNNNSSTRRETREDKTEDQRRDKVKGNRREIRLWLSGFFLSPKLPDPWIISNFQISITNPESILIFPEICCLRLQIKMFSRINLVIILAAMVRGIYFIDPEDKELMQQKIGNTDGLAMPCKTCKKNKHGETRSKTNDFKSKFACILEAGESTRMRMENLYQKYHEDHVAGKGDNSLQYYNLVHKFIPMPQAMRIPAAKAAVDKKWDKLEKDSGVGPERSQK